MTDLLDILASLQKEACSIVKAVDEQDYPRQFHDDLSPLGWHLGHCVYTETFWITEKLLNKAAVSDELKTLYIPNLSPKKSRSAALPGRHKLLEWVRNNQAKNREALISALDGGMSHPLLDNYFLPHFLIQHYSQHIETMYMVLTEIQLVKTPREITISEPLVAVEPVKVMEQVAGGVYQIGSDNPGLPYDNEHPQHNRRLAPFNISRQPVNNGEFLAFMESGAYLERKYWSEAGWRWRQKGNVTCPHHWRRQSGYWIGVDHNGAYRLLANQAVHGISYYEAQAYANWVGARLPHEYEWETACRQNLLKDVSLVWEWCDNLFHDYDGFTPWPYEGYSKPYFDKRHYVMRGSSRYTKEAIKRQAFRNYYTADKRHILAGIRLAYD